MIRMKSMAGLLLAAIAATGCTELQVRKLDPSPDRIDGIPYALPQKTFLLTIQYELTACDARSRSSGDYEARLEVRKKIEPPSAVSEVDPEERFVIPYEGIRNWFKTTDITVEYHESRTLKSMEATIEDKTGPALTAAIATGTKISALVSGPSLATAVTKEREQRPSAGPRQIFCPANIRRALAEVDRLEREKTAAAKPEDKLKLAAEIEQEKKPLLYRQTYSWTPARGASPQAFRAYPMRVLGLWLTGAGRDVAEADPPPTLATSMEFRPHKGEMLSSTKAVAPAVNDGMLVRYPVVGMLYVCDPTCLPEDTVTNVQRAEEQLVPQLGPYVSLPLRNRIFEHQTLKLTVSDKGVITKLGYKSVASAEAAFTWINTNLDAITKAQAEQEKARQAARAAGAAPTAKQEAERIAAENQAIATCLEAQAALRKAGGVPIGTCQ